MGQGCLFCSCPRDSRCLTRNTKPIRILHHGSCCLNTGALFQSLLLQPLSPTPCSRLQRSNLLSRWLQDVPLRHRFTCSGQSSAHNPQWLPTSSAQSRGPHLASRLDSYCPCGHSDLQCCLLLTHAATDLLGSLWCFQDTKCLCSIHFQPYSLGWVGG